MLSFTKKLCQILDLATSLVALGDLCSHCSLPRAIAINPLSIPAPAAKEDGARPCPTLAETLSAPNTPLMAGTSRFTPTLPKSHLGTTLCSARFPGPSPFDRALRGSKRVPDFCPALCRLGELRLPAQSLGRAEGGWRHHLHLWVCWAPWPASLSLRGSQCLNHHRFISCTRGPAWCQECQSPGEVFPRDVFQGG